MADTLKLGITPWQIYSELNSETLCRQAEQAEAWGYHSFWMPESHMDGPFSIPEPMLMLAAVAARTHRIKLATSSYLLPIRHPIQAAEQVAVLDQLSEGRLILGLGRGYKAAMLKAFGVDSALKRQHFDKTLSQMKALWRGEAVSGQLLSPRPKQQPHPPLWVAAFGPKALTQVARLGLPYLASPMESLAELVKNQTHYHLSLATAGQQAPAVVPVMRTIFISEQEKRCEQVRQALANTIKALPAAMQRDVNEVCLIGNAEQVSDIICQYKHKLGLNYLIAIRPRASGIPAEWIEASMQQLVENTSS